MSRVSQFYSLYSSWSISRCEAPWTNGGLTLPRPNIKEVIHGFVGNQRIAVIGCGPNGLKVDVCNAVAGVQRRVWMGESFSKEIMLHTETFDW